MSERLARFHVIVHASNRHVGLGKPLTVIAATRRDAVHRAVALGWSGNSRDARVTIQNIEDIDPRECACRECSDAGNTTLAFLLTLATLCAVAWFAVDNVPGVVEAMTVGVLRILGYGVGGCVMAAASVAVLCACVRAES